MLWGRPHVPGTRTNLNGVAGATEEAARVACTYHLPPGLTLTSGPLPAAVLASDNAQCELAATNAPLSYQWVLEAGGEGSAVRALCSGLRRGQLPGHPHKYAELPLPHPLTGGGAEPHHRYKGERGLGTGHRAGRAHPLLEEGTVHVCDLTPCLWSH